MKFRRKCIKTDIQTISWVRELDKTFIYETHRCKLQVKIGWFWITIKRYWLEVLP
jgi:hypothetical protein